MTPIQPDILAKLTTQANEEAGGYRPDALSQIAYATGRLRGLLELHQMQEENRLLREELHPSPDKCEHRWTESHGYDKPVPANEESRTEPANSPVAAGDAPKEQGGTSTSQG